MGVHEPEPLDSQSLSWRTGVVGCSELGMGISSAPVEKRRGVESKRPVSRSKELRRIGARLSASPRIERPRRSASRRESGVELPLRLSMAMGECVCVSKREELVVKVWWSCLHNPRSRISRCYAEFGRQRVCGVVMSSRLLV